MEYVPEELRNYPIYIERLRLLEAKGYELRPSTGAWYWYDDLGHRVSSVYGHADVLSAIRWGNEELN